MVRSAVADESFLKYMITFAKPNTCTIGLILGQPTSIKDYVIHFARTPPYSENKEKASPSKPILKITDISDNWVADHARHATRMLPGGMYVLGIFVVAEEDVLSPFSTKIKSIFTQAHRKLCSNEFLYGNPNITERLIVNYCIKTQTYSCRSYDIETGMTKPAEIKFQQKLSIKWLQVECRYELEQFFPILMEKDNWPLKKHMQDILLSINRDLKSAIFFFDDEIKDGDDNLENVAKKRKVPRGKFGHNESSDSKPIQVTIILPCDGRYSNDSLQVIERGGYIKLTGHIVSKLWLHPKATVNDACQAVIQDICRSLSARLEMHWDSLIEGELASSKDTNSIHEPPRRVLINLPSSKVTLSDYLFPGEGLQEAQISLQELLDIQITDGEAVLDLEGQADLTDLCSEGRLEADSDEMLQKLPNRYIYFTGLGIAFLVLIISLMVHFVKNF